GLRSNDEPCHTIFALLPTVRTRNQGRRVLHPRRRGWTPVVGDERRVSSEIRQGAGEVRKLPQLSRKHRQPERRPFDDSFRGSRRKYMGWSAPDSSRFLQQAIASL